MPWTKQTPKTLQAKGGTASHVRLDRGRHQALNYLQKYYEEVHDLEASHQVIFRRALDCLLRDITQTLLKLRKLEKESQAYAQTIALERLHILNAAQQVVVNREITPEDYEGDTFPTFDEIQTQRWYVEP